MRIGILGGTFNPPHYGHLNMAKAALDGGFLDRVIFVPNGNPPHKQLEISACDRRGMVGAMIAGDPRMSVSDVELSREGKSYMADTVSILCGQYPDDQLFLMAGADMLAGITGWYRAKEILDAVPLLGFTRKGEPSIERIVRFLERNHVRVSVVEAELPGVSSTEIRNCIRDGKPVDGMLPETVEEYIRKHGLYTATPACSGDIAGGSGETEDIGNTPA